MTPALDVIIVAYRCEAMLRRCLLSLEAHPAAGGQRVIVVDNASGDGTAAMVAREFAGAELIEAGANLGFSRANNLALERSDAPFVLLLNPDTEVTAGALDALLELIARRHEVGLCGPRLELPDGSFDHAARRGFPSPVSALGHFTGVGRRAGASGELAAYRAPETEAGPVDAVNGAFMLLRRSALDQVGALDPGYWMYMEDLDLCWRLACAGWVTWYEPSVTVVHVKSGSAGRPRPLRLNRAFHAGMDRFYRDNYAARRSSPTNLVVRAGIRAKLAVSIARSAPGLIRRRLRKGP